MNEIDKINEELRNYKLFKIQRVTTRKQEFDEVKSQILKTIGNEILNYFILFINFIAIAFLIYNIVKSFQQTDYFSTNTTIIVLNFILVLGLSIYTSIKLFVYSKRIKMQLTATENAIQHLSTDIEVLKAEYETYVNEYLKK